MTTCVLRCARVVTAAGVLAPATLTIRAGRIASVLPGGPSTESPPQALAEEASPGAPTGPPPDALAEEDAPGPSTGQPAVEAAEDVAGWVLPGFVDTHCHGGGGFEYATTDPAQARRVREFHLASGTTSTFASLVTAGVDRLCAQLRALAPLVSAGELAGLHLEGPFLSPRRCGVHDRSALRAPSAELLDRLLGAAEGALAAVTLAPELPGALAAISHLVRAGVRVAVGHTDADDVTIRAALDAGATVATHLFNAMPPVHHRRPGPVPRLLTDSRVTVELIADGVHVHPDLLALAVKAATASRVALVTDAVAAAGQPDGRYRLGPARVVVSGGQARLATPEGTPGPLAGSTLTMARAVAHAMRLGLPVPAVAQLAATTPAAAYGLRDVGSIAAGHRADFCVVDDEGNLRRVMRRGAWVEPHQLPV